MPDTVGGGSKGVFCGTKHLSLEPFFLGARCMVVAAATVGNNGSLQIMDF